MSIQIAGPGKGAHLLARTALALSLIGTAVVSATPATMAQAASAATRVQGTVKAISGTTLTVDTGNGQTQTVAVPEGARVRQSADMKTVSASSFGEIGVGDRVLATGTPGDGGALTASSVILIKSTAITQRNQASQADWNRRGSGGIVTAVDPAANTIGISSGTRKVTVSVTGSTIYRRYAPGSVRFEDAKPGTLADIHAGDQLRVRGDRSADGATITAEEVVSGAFKNLSGTVISVNAGANSLVLKDIASKKNQTVSISDASDLRALPPEMAARFAARRPGAGGGSGAPAGGGAPAGAAPATGENTPADGAGRRPGSYGGGNGTGGGAGYGANRGPGGPGGRGGADLAAMIPRLPKATLADLKPGEALMIVASENAGGGAYTAITLLTGVEPILTSPAGSEVTLAPWSLGAAGGGEGGGPE